MTSSRRGSYISTQLESINAQLQTLFDDLGVSIEERDNREKKVYAIIAEALENHVQEVKVERDELRTKCIHLKQNIHKMSLALWDVDLNLLFGPLSDLVHSEVEAHYISTEKSLNIAFKQLDVVYTERSNQAKQLIADLNSLSEKVDGMALPEDLKLSSSKELLDLSKNYLSRLEAELQRWRNELKSRISQASVMATQIVTLWAELGTSQDSIDRNIMTHYKSEPELLGTTLIEINNLKEMNQSLLQEKGHREGRINILSKVIHLLWSKLSEDEEYIAKFERVNRGLGPNVLEAFEIEHNRLQDKKREHIHIFIQDARDRLQELWTQLYFSEEETFCFTPAWADIFTDASLEAHESEIIKLDALLEERKPILKLIDAFTDLQTEEKQLEASTQDASRLLTRGNGKRDPTRLLREEKMRKRLAKRKPIILKELKDGIELWEDRHSKPFLINGELFHILFDSELSKTGLKRSGYAAPLRNQAPPSAPATPAKVNRNLSASLPNGPVQTPIRSPMKAFAKPVVKNQLSMNSSAKVRLIGPPAKNGSATTRTFSMSSATLKTPVKGNSRIKGLTSSALSKTPNIDPLGKTYSTPQSPTKGNINPKSTALTTPIRPASSFIKAEERPQSSDCLSNLTHNGPSSSINSLKPREDGGSYLRSRSELGNYLKYNESIQGNRSPSRLASQKNAEEFVIPSNSGSTTRSRLGSNASNITIPRSISSLTNYRSISPQKTGHYTSDNSRNPSHTSSQPSRTTSNSSSENWQALHEGSSSEDEFRDPAYQKWREDAVKGLEITPHTPTVTKNVDDLPLSGTVHDRTQRLSEFN